MRRSILEAQIRSKYGEGVQPYRDYDPSVSVVIIISVTRSDILQLRARLPAFHCYSGAGLPLLPCFDLPAQPSYRQSWIRVSIAIPAPDDNDILFLGRRAYRSVFSSSTRRTSESHAQLPHHSPYDARIQTKEFTRKGWACLRCAGGIRVNYHPSWFSRAV